jgi:DNA-binding NarL/FixJ family response regulator
MDLTLSPREQSAFRRVLLADHDPTALVSEHVAEALNALVPCDVIQTGEGDARGFVLRGVDYPDGLLADQGSQVCDGPWNTGFEHFAALSEVDQEAAAARRFGERDTLRLGFTTRAGMVVAVSFVHRNRLFTERDIAVLVMLEPALARLLKAGAFGTSAPKLTTSERRVLEHVAVGLSNRQAAEELFVTEATVRKHLENAYRKLGVSNRTGALAAMRQNN